MKQLNEALQYVRGLVSENAAIMWGTVDNKESDDEIVVTFIASGVKMWDHQLAPIVRPLKENKVSQTVRSMALGEQTSDFSEKIRLFGSGITERRPVKQQKGLKVPLDKMGARSVDLQTNIAQKPSDTYHQQKMVANQRQHEVVRTDKTSEQRKALGQVGRQQVLNTDRQVVNMGQGGEHQEAKPVIPPFLIRNGKS